MTTAIRRVDSQSGVTPRAAVRLDPLADALECLGLASWIPGPWELTAPWALRVDTRLGWFYLATRGGGLLIVDSVATCVRVAPGDLVIVFQGHQHRLLSDADAPIAAIQTLLEQRHFVQRESLVHGGGGDATRLLSGCFRLEGLERSPLQAALPPCIQVKGANDGAAPYVDHIVRLIEMETALPTRGDPSIINRLTRILLTKALQGHLAALPVESVNWLRALADPDIGRALALMHAQPGERWTVGALAERVGLARSTFAARFAELVGQPPLEYLTHWRIQKACLLLRTTRAELKEIAGQVGYESRSAFSKAFTNCVGGAPGAYRRASDGGAGAPATSMPTL